jgi:hypothetical protein
LAAAAAVTMFGMSSSAVAQSAAPLSIAGQTTAAAPAQDANQIRGGFILPTLALIIIGVLIYVVTKDNNPSSP